MLFNLVVLVMLLLTFAVQEFVPSVEIAHHATLFLPPVFFFAAAVAVPFSSMLLLAFLAALCLVCPCCFLGSWDPSCKAFGHFSKEGVWNFPC